MRRMRLSIPILIGPGIINPVKTGVSYLFRDKFTTPAAAGSVNGTAAEPGPGTREVVDSGGALIRIATPGLLELKGDTSWSNGTFSVSQAIIRGMGVAIFFRVIYPASATSGAFGLSSAKNSLYLANGKEYFPTTVPNLLQFEGNGPKVSAGLEYEICMILRPKGCYYLIRGGIEYPEWTHIYTSFTDTTATLYWVAESYHANFWSYKDLRFVQLGAPFAADYALATNRVAVAGVNEVITHEADGHIELTWTAVTGQTLTVLFRRVDDDNCWKLECAQAGTIKLFKREAGVDTEVDTGKTQTWTNGTAYRIIVRFWGQRIVTQVGVTNKHTYITAAFNQTATTAKTDKAGANFIAWPWTLTGAALAEVKRVSGAFDGSTPYVSSNFTYASSVEVA